MTNENIERNLLPTGKKLKEKFIKEFGKWNTHSKTVCYVILKDRGYSINQIKSTFGLKSHQTVISGVRRMRNVIKYSPGDKKVEKVIKFYNENIELPPIKTLQSKMNGRNKAL